MIVFLRRYLRAVRVAHLKARQDAADHIAWAEGLLRSPDSRREP